VGNNSKVKLFVIAAPGDTETPTKKMHGLVFIRQPIRVELNERPAMLKFKQDMMVPEDPKDIQGKGKQKMVTVEGYFRRIDWHDYIQMDALQLKKVLGWMQVNEVDPKDLTCTHIDTALASKVEIPDLQPEIVVPGEDQKTKGGIIVPGGVK
jgi:hypothetical protein